MLFPDLNSEDSLAEVANPGPPIHNVSGLGSLGWGHSSALRARRTVVSTMTSLQVDPSMPSVGGSVG